MTVPLAALANAVATTPLPAPALDGVTTAFLAALAPVWPALEPWLIAGGVVVVMGVATEVVVRELQRLARVPVPARERAETTR